MKAFKSFIAEKLEEYIAYREGLGYMEKNLRLCLSYLDGYLAEQAPDWDIFTPLFFLTFRASLTINAKSINGIMTAIKGFFQYLQRIEHCSSNPLSDIPPQKELPYLPYVFSEAEVELFLKAVQKRIRKDKKYFLNDLAQYIALLFLARCGLRISEPISLLLNNYHPDEASIYIEKTKFKKDRLIPIPMALVEEIENYLAVRRALLPHDENPFLLVTSAGKSLYRAQFYPIFKKILADINIKQEKQTKGNTTFGKPTPHSFRHALAVNTLKRIKEQGKSPQHALPVLSAYMGHRHYTDTAVYLKVVDAKQRLQLFNFAKNKETL
jgi:site-specific recombinase XerD